jgi:hypothetical protein
MQTRTRCHHIAISTPQDDAKKLVTFCREKINEVEIDGVLTRIGKTDDQPSDVVTNFVADIAPTIRTVYDAVQGKEVTFSGAAMAAWISAEADVRNAQ